MPGHPATPNPKKFYPEILATLWQQFMPADHYQPITKRKNYNILVASPIWKQSLQKWQHFGNKTQQFIQKVVP